MAQRKTVLRQPKVPVLKAFLDAIDEEVLGKRYELIDRNIEVEGGSDATRDLSSSHLYTMCMDSHSQTLRTYIVKSLEI